MSYFRCSVFDFFDIFCIERKKECKCDKCCPKPICQKGATGATGPAGVTPSFSIGSVTLDVAGGNGNVILNPASTVTNVILDFMLPNPAFTATAESLPAGDTPTVVVTQSYKEA